MAPIDNPYFLDCVFLLGSTQALGLVLPLLVIVKTWSLVKEVDSWKAEPLVLKLFDKKFVNIVIFLVLLPLEEVQNTGLVGNFHQIKYWSNFSLNVGTICHVSEIWG